MQDVFSGTELPSAPRRDGSIDGVAVAAVASRVVSLLAARSAGSPDEERAELVARLYDAALVDDPTARNEIAAIIRRRRLPPRYIVDECMPKAARDLGQAWLDDRLSFAEVTLATARLQALLRVFDTPPAEAGHRGSAGSVLLVVPGDEQHTFGALVAASQLRRAGVEVCLRMKPARAELHELVSSGRFDALMLSVACTSSLDLSGKLVASLRAWAPHCPIVVGGALVAERDDLAEVTGSDHATNDTAVALRLCGLCESDGFQLRHA
jgi:methylmalonyl-CoA mutase cobalamin-binding subunit